MTLAAVDGLEDAFVATRELLFPVDVKRWLRLAVIAFFVGGAGGAGGGAGGGDGGGTGGGAMPFPDVVPGVPTLSDALLAVIVGLIALVLLIALAYALLGAIMEFVLVESLRAEAVHLRRYTRRYWRPGLRLFGFRLGVGLVVAAVGLVLVLGILVAVGALGPGHPGPLRVALGLVIGLPALLAVAIAAALVLGFTTSFVVPVMLLEETTVLGGWRRFWPTLRSAWQEYLVYALLTVLLRLVVGLAAAIVIGIAAAVVVAPLGLVAVAGLFATGFQLGPAAWVGLGFLVVLAVVLVAAIAAVVQVPVVTYFRYYALFVLGDTESAFDVIGERRAAVRAES